MSEPLIPIKKPDGTFVKVTMAEFLAMKKPQTVPSAPQVAAAKPASVVTPVQSIQKSPVITPVIEKAASYNHADRSVHAVQNKARIEVKKDKPSSVAADRSKPLTRDDARSPLEEKITSKSNSPLTSHKRESQVEEVIRKLGFGVAPDLLGRLKSLILARLKDIKSEDEVREVLLRAVAAGGLGLAAGQIDKIVAAIQEVHSKHHATVTAGSLDVPVLKGKSGMSLMVEPPELPAVAVEVAPKKYTDVYKDAHIQPKPELVPPDDLVSKLVKESFANEPVFKISSKSTPKQFVQDISAPDVGMGPVEEIRSITLADFRKLSGNPEEAAKRLQQKILNLQEESFIWYLDAMNAYHSSPLYLEYIQAVCQSMTERKSLANVLMMKNGIKLSEAVAIIEMEKSL